MTTATVECIVLYNVRNTRQMKTRRQNLYRKNEMLIFVFQSKYEVTTY